MLALLYFTKNPHNREEPHYKIETETFDVYAA